MTSDTHEVPSPCIRHCCLNDKDMCVGCFRMMDEILIWGQANNKSKHSILEQCELRKRQCKTDISF
ncbi:DUF1289 domain-containing protein [uncultured Paraglaciecola sp.]|uniref:DUF1289 domain-containing protein n=1 Tax=uncultured Paraglaciecola sp. TaxID=1765024 RepID=UPI0026332BBB|nr:DUF1289 domain-containing protein [uncultured Paraglaciecola sp.]